MNVRLAEEQERVDDFFDGIWTVRLTGRLILARFLLLLFDQVNVLKLHDLPFHEPSPHHTDSHLSGLAVKPAEPDDFLVREKLEQSFEREGLADYPHDSIFYLMFSAYTSFHLCVFFLKFSKPKFRKLSQSDLEAFLKLQKIDRWA